MRLRKQLYIMIEEYVEGYFGGDRNKAIELWRMGYSKIGNKYNINIGKEAKKLGISKLDYLEEQNLIEDLYDYLKRLVDNGMSYWDKKSSKG